MARRPAPSHTTDHGGDVCILRPTTTAGSVDARSFAALLRSAVEGGAEKLIVDLSDVSYLDATALGMLLDRAKKLEDDGGQLVVVASHRQLLREFERTRLDRLLRIDPTPQLALSEFGGRRDS